MNHFISQDMSDSMTESVSTGKIIYKKGLFMKHSYVCP